MSRSSYDQQLQMMFGEIDEHYNAPPLPSRTHYDTRLQQGWCPDCQKPQMNPQPEALFPHKEKYEPLFGFRTHYDQQLQHHWCSTCNGPPHHVPPHHVPKHVVHPHHVPKHGART